MLPVTDTSARSTAPRGVAALAPLLSAVAILALAGCGGKPAKPPPPTPTVGVVTIRTQPVTTSTELPGRTDAYRTSEVRPQVAGLILRRLFTEGAIVHEGQPLYLIDPALYRANVAQATASLQSAAANQVTAQLKSQRYQSLVGINAVARQDADDARAAAGQANAAVAQARAQLRTARINLRYTNVNAPITGRIGRSTYTVGALVTAAQTDPLATIQQLDPIYVDIQQSSAELLALRKELSGGATPASTAVRLKLEDGSDYAAPGRLEFAEVTVDASTGSVTLRARFPNPAGVLLPGMFVRAVIDQAVRADGILVPQTGVGRSPRGDATVLLVGPGDKVVQRTIVTGGTMGANWIVNSGLKPGDRVIVEGLQNAKPGQKVKVARASTITGGTAPAATANSARRLSDKEREQAESGKQQGR